MVSLTDNFNVGNVSAPSLIKSAATLTNELDSYNDEEAKITFENSGYTDAAYQAYTSYLQGRVSTLSASDTVTDQTKAIGMQQDIVTATHSNISYHIQQANIQVMASDDGGTAQGYQTKMNVVGAQYQTAVAIGDTTLADSLESQYYSLSQSYQNALTTSSNSADALSAANGEHTATTLEDSLKDLNDALGEAGPAGTNTAIKNWISSSGIEKNLNAMGVQLPGGAAPNYFDIVSGITQAMANAHYNAATAMQGSSSEDAPMDVQTYYADYTNIMNGITSMPTLGGSMTLQAMQTAAANPNMYVASENADGTWSYKVSDIVGYTTKGTTTNVNNQVVPNVVPVYSGNLTKTYGNQSTISKLQKMGFNVITTSSSSITNGYQVEASNKLPSYLQKLMPSKNAAFYVQQMPNGTMQFVIPDSTGAPQIITLATDNKNLTGAFNTTTGKPTAVGGQYGFDESTNSLINAGEATQARTTALRNQINTVQAAKTAQAVAIKALAQGKPATAPIAKTPPPLALPKAPAPPLAKAAGPAAPNALQKAAEAPNKSSNPVERVATDVGHAAEGVVGAIGSLF